MPERARGDAGESSWKVSKHCDPLEPDCVTDDQSARICFQQLDPVFPLGQSLIRGVMNHFGGDKIVNDSLFTLVVYNYTEKKRKYFASWAEEVEFLFPFLFFFPSFLEIDFQDLH